MTDYILRVTAFDGMIRAFFATSQACVQKASDHHHTTLLPLPLLADY